MRILAIKPGHDGTLASVCDGRLEFSIEQEKDSHPRYSRLSIPVALQAFERLPAVPDVVALGGWHGSVGRYFGLEPPERTRRRLFGHSLEWFFSSHEKSHLFGAYALSPFEQGRPCYALVWEGQIGSFYHIDANLKITRFPFVLTGPGDRFAYLFFLADPSRRIFTDILDMPGKLMALAGFGRDGPLRAEERELIDYLLQEREADAERLSQQCFVAKGKLRLRTPYLDIGVHDQGFRDLARKFSNRLFEEFHRFAAEHLTEKLPLLIGGGCGLNCDWNSRWRDSGLFAEVFVPPCCNDSGSAIGTAAEAQFCHTGNAKLAWSVYAGEEFLDNWPAPLGWEVSPLSLTAVAALLEKGEVVAWVQGRCEIGPRALGNRSLLAAPFEPKTAAELNRIKGREDYRPIAPVCLREDVAEHFEGQAESPFMLYFQRVKNPALRAVTHADGSARVQTVRAEQNPRLHELLRAFKARTGVGVLCNTSLNFKGLGFINRTTHLMEWAMASGVRVVVINERLFRRENGSVRSGGSPGR